MSMNVERRKFLILSLASTVGFSFLNGFIPPSEQPLKEVAKKPSVSPSLLDSYQLKTDEVYVVKGYDEILPPVNPKIGDSFYLVIDQGSLENPGCLVFNEALIDGQPESLELDVLANIKVTYLGENEGWRIS